MTKSISELTLAIYKKGLQLLYRNVKDPERLPWHTKNPPKILSGIFNSRTRPGRVLDIGCGTGMTAILFAQKGYEVTALDFIDEALCIARKNADTAGVNIEFIEADFLKWQPSIKYDVVFDAGCLHGISGVSRNIYKQQLLHCLNNGGDYVLIHFEKRHALDYRPVGPRRVCRTGINRFFSPELKEVEFQSNRVSQPLPIGPTVSVGAYWFKK